LRNPESKKNEEYIENYYILQGIVTKPRVGLLVEFYSNIKKQYIIIFIIIMFPLGAFLFFFDRFEVFVRLNILLLIIGIVISIILAVVTWHKRWYSAIGFLFRKNIDKE